MKFSLPLLTLTLLSLTAQAANEIPAFPLENISAVVTADWNGDGGLDRAFLVEASGPDSDNVDLVIYLSTTLEGPMKLQVHKSRLVPRGTKLGMQPELRLDKNNNLQVIAQNTTFGNSFWSETLTLAYRNQEFVVVDYAYTWQDATKRGECTVNLLTRQGVKNGKEFQTAAKAVPVSAWSDSTAPEECYEQPIAR